MKTLYLDIFSGISGDMFLGAMIDLGLELDALNRALAKLNIGGYHLHAAKTQSAGIEGVRFTVHLEEQPHSPEHHGHPLDPSHDHAHAHAHPPHSGAELPAAPEPADHGLISHHHPPPETHGRSFAQIRDLIQASALSDWVKQKAVAVFERIAVAEGKIHGRPPEQVHFHEVGAIDSIVDIVGACVALELLERPRVLAAPVVEGTGWVRCAHGTLPLPAPATLAILGVRGVALTQCDEPGELVTPTGAALLAEFAEGFGPMTGLVAAKIGYGIGSRTTRTRPNVLRVILSDSVSATHDWEMDTIGVLATNLDDANAEVLGHFMDLALSQGALDVFHTPIQMKKNRPGVLLTVLCSAADQDKMTELILRETGAFGVRRTLVERRKLQREFATVSTPYGPVTVKIGKLDGQIVQAKPEFDSCKALAAQARVPVKQILTAACQAMRLAGPA